MKKFPSFVLLTLILLFFSSCINTGGDINIDYEKIHTGTEGLVISTASGAPPPEVLTGDRFTLYAKLENRGAAPIEGGIMKLIQNKDYITPLTKTEETINLEGKSLLNPVGGVIFSEYDLEATKDLKGNMSTYHQSELILLACYPYFSSMRKEVCIDSDVFNINKENKEKVCQVAVLNPSSQGGPVVIYKIEPMFTTQADSATKYVQVVPQYLIYIKNSGAGQVVASDKVDLACGNAQEGEDFWNVVYVSAKLNDEKMNCEPSTTASGIATLRLREGLDFVKCKAQTAIPTGSPTYVTILEVNATYGYTESISRIVKIRRIV